MIPLPGENPKRNRTKDQFLFNKSSKKSKLPTASNFPNDEIIVLASDDDRVNDTDYQVSPLFSSQMASQIPLPGEPPKRIEDEDHLLKEDDPNAQPLSVSQDDEVLLLESDDVPVSDSDRVLSLVKRALAAKTDNANVLLIQKVVQNEDEEKMAIRLVKALLEALVERRKLAPRQKASVDLGFQLREQRRVLRQVSDTDISITQIGCSYNCKS